MKIGLPLLFSSGRYHVKRVLGTKMPKVRYWNGNAYKLISWSEDEETAFNLADTLLRTNDVKIVLNQKEYGVYYKEQWR